MADHTVDRHIGYFWQRNPPLGSATGCPELRSMVLVLPSDHLLVCLELRQDYPNLWDRSEPLQGLQGVAAVYGFV